MSTGKLAKAKKQNLPKLKKSELAKAKKLDSAMAQTFGMDFLSLKAKKTFMYL